MYQHDSAELKANAVKMVLKELKTLGAVEVLIVLVNSPCTPPSHSLD
jgi:hypothetical protein